MLLIFFIFYMSRPTVGHPETQRDDGHLPARGDSQNVERQMNNRILSIMNETPDDSSSMCSTVPIPFEEVDNADHGCSTSLDGNVEHATGSQQPPGQQHGGQGMRENNELCDYQTTTNQAVRQDYTIQQIVYRVARDLGCAWEEGMETMVRMVAQEVLRLSRVYQGHQGAALATAAAACAAYRDPVFELGIALTPA